VDLLQIHPTDKDKIIESLVNDIHQLKNELDDIKNKRVVESLQLDEKAIIDSIRIIEKDIRFNRELSESEIKEAQSHTDSATESAKYLEVSYKIYRKYCKQYGIWKTNPWSKGSKKKYFDPSRGKYPLNDILTGKYPNYSTYRLKDLLIRSGIKANRCERCKEGRRRFGDNEIPLLLDHIDGNTKNHKLDNLEILCYNCIFLFGRGYLRGRKANFCFQKLI
jgi:hypothetical protein